MKKYSKEELFKMDAVDVYKLLLNNKIGRFPSGFWQQPEARQNAIKCIRFLIEELLGYSDEDIRERYSFKQFRENSLMGMLASCFNSSPYEALSATYPGKFQPWELKYVPSGYWSDINNGIEATRWLIKHKLNWSNEDIKKNLSQNTFYSNGLGGMLDTCFNSSPYEALNTTYPGKFQPWELACVPNGVWNDINNGIEATRWLIETKLGWSDEDVKNKLSKDTFLDNGLGGMLNCCFKGSPYRAIDCAYPQRFKPSDFKYQRILND